MLSMLRSSWKKELFRLWFKLTLPRTVRPKFQFAHPRLQILEDRLAPAVALVGYYDRNLSIALPNDQTTPVTLTITEMTETAFTISLNPGNTFELGPNGVSNGAIITSSSMTWTMSTEFDYTLYGLYVTGPLGTTPGQEIASAATDIWDTINVTCAVNFLGDWITLQGYQINLTETSTLTAGTGVVSLESVESLNFNQTGLPYTGNLNINQPPSPGQPFANNQYISGPNWSNYGYAAGDAVTLTYMPSSGTTTTTATLTIVDIIENNMYFTTGTIIPYGSQSNATINPSTTFTPQVNAETISLAVTGLGNSITGAIANSLYGGVE